MKSKQDLKALYQKDVSEALQTLKHSMQKLKSSTIPDKANTDLDGMEPWEALSARFARTTDIFLSKLVRFLVLEKDPAFRGEIRDFVDKAEKIGILTNADRWMEIRELRNKIAHEYSKEDLVRTLQSILKFVPFVVDELERLKL